MSTNLWETYTASEKSLTRMMSKTHSASSFSPAWRASQNRLPVSLPSQFCENTEEFERSRSSVEISFMMFAIE